LVLCLQSRKGTPCNGCLLLLYLLLLLLLLLWLCQ
jgi:hypothetical protein